jgi:hypothetical protein
MAKVFDTLNCRHCCDTQDVHHDGRMYRCTLCRNVVESPADPTACPVHAKAGALMSHPSSTSRRLGHRRPGNARTGQRAPRRRRPAPSQAALLHGAQRDHPRQQVLPGVGLCSTPPLENP